MLFETVDRENVDTLVRKFYAKILKDKTVGPYFIRTLGSDLSKGKWPGHISTLKSFWMLMMNGKAGYNGHPFPPHALIGQLYIETFDRWLELFKETVYEMYIPEIAEKFYTKSEIVAEQFIEYLELDEEEEE